MTDPIADLLTRLRNSAANERATTTVPFSKMCLSICKVLQHEGFLWEVEVSDVDARKTISVSLKYGTNGERVLNHLRRVSSSGRRRYLQRHRLGKIRRGTGILVLTTSAGVISHRQAMKLGVGGEVLAEIW